MLEVAGVPRQKLTQARREHTRQDLNPEPLNCEADGLTTTSLYCEYHENINSKTRQERIIGAG